MITGDLYARTKYRCLLQVMQEDVLLKNCINATDIHNRDSFTSPFSFATFVASCFYLFAIIEAEGFMTCCSPLSPPWATGTFGFHF